MYVFPSLLSQKRQIHVPHGGGEGISFACSGMRLLSAPFEGGAPSELGGVQAHRGGQLEPLFAVIPHTLPYRFRTARGRTQHALHPQSAALCPRTPWLEQPSPDSCA
ncbi:hypothetical protein KIL84_000068 [Mauremys mutica]|uniref:Uncharacterized protein n=1 Tax=Mauremys mutica TaxID=74926 RepID=A0A9D4AW99_9SAUR|nr:hypothetical protein KIL84_000068 [Mauremys mutica]